MGQERSGVTDSNHPDWQQYHPEGHGRTDEQIRADVHELLQRESGAHKQLDLEVADGVVTLKGTLQGETDLLERIRAIPSVKSARAQAS
jgi:osmotically-inducible protein OsmY